MYKRGIYKGLAEKEILKKVTEKGFKPLKFSNSPGYIYRKHSHPETKLLVFLAGDMEVHVGNKKYICKKDDELIIPGNIKHWAKAGKEGCTIFWSERLLEET